MPFDPTNIYSVAKFVIYGGGSAVIVGVLLSAFGERWAWFQGLTPGGKEVFQKFGSAIVALGVWALMTYLPPAWIAWAVIPFSVIAVAVTATTINQFSHTQRKLGNLNVTQLTAALSALTPSLPVPPALVQTPVVPPAPTGPSS